MNTTTQATHKYKNSPLGLIPEDWEVKALASISNRIGDGLHGTPKYVSESDYFFVNGNNLKNNIIEIDKNTKCVSYEEYLKHKKDLSSNCLLLSINGTIGNLSFYNNEKIVLGKSAAYINCKPESINYIFYYLQSSKVNSFFDNELTGSTIRNLSLKSIREIPILLPPTEEQAAIANCLSTWDNAIEKHTALIAQKELAKKALMQQLLSGKKRLKGFSGEWREVRLGDVGKIKMCKRVFNDETSIEGEIPFYKIGTFGKKADAFISRKLYDDYRAKFSFPKKGEILISASGTLGRTVVYDGNPAYFQDSNIVWVSHNESKVINKYLFYVYKIIRYDSEGGTIQRLYNSIISGVKLNLPILEEQTAIATVLQCADREIQLLKTKLAQLKEQKKGLMQVLLTGKKRLRF